MSARLLLEQGHQVVLHARSAARAADAQRSLPSAEAVVVGDLSSVAQARAVAEQTNRLGRFDSVITTPVWVIGSHAVSRQRTVCRTSSP